MADIGVIGLAVMGENLVLNFESKGFKVAVYNRTTTKVEAFINGRAKGKKIIGTFSLEELVKSLKPPRRVMMMIQAGKAVDEQIKALIPLLEKGDILIDGGNSEFQDTARRVVEVEARGLLYVGTGVSGGEEGALKGPSLMPGGSRDAWQHIKPLFQAIAAKVSDGSPCCDWVGQGGAGHFIKMVHNGVEYGDMQLIAEAYWILKNLLGLSNDELSAVFAEWNRGDLDSYLIEITADILAKKDDRGDGYLVDQIYDSAGQKGTGKWTAISALDMGLPLTLIGEAVFARCLSSQKDERVQASKIIRGVKPRPFKGDKKAFIAQVKDALFASKIISYAQGFVLIRQASREYKWNIDLGACALMWRGGCIIRSAFLGDIKAAFDKNKDLENLLLDDFFRKKVEAAEEGWRAVLAQAIVEGIPSPCFGSALAYYDGYRSSELPANLLQAQRDYFGAHGYQRLDSKRGEFFHTNWTGRGGNTASTQYNV